MQLLYITLFSTSDWINTITAFAALITAFIALRTVIEIKRQREHSYHPDIDIANFEFYVYRYDTEDLEGKPEDLIYLFFSQKKLDTDQSIEGFNELTLGINNVGFGVAKEVTWSWSFDYSAARKITGLNKEQFEYDAETGGLRIIYPELKVDWIYELDEDNDAKSFNFILPYSIENRKIEIAIPNYFMSLYWLFMVKGLTANSIRDETDFPPLKLSAYYKNLDGKKVSKTFNLYLRFTFIGNPQQSTKELGCFRFEIVETK